MSEDDMLTLNKYVSALRDRVLSKRHPAKTPVFQSTAKPSALNCINWLVNRLLIGWLWPIRFDVRIETMVSIVTSNLVGQNSLVNCRLSAGNRQNFFFYTIGHRCRLITPKNIVCRKNHLFQCSKSLNVA